MTAALAFPQALLDAFEAHVAVVDADGRVVAVNRAWRRFGEENGDPDAGGVGSNYLAATLAGNPALARDLRRVLDGDLPAHEFVYPCHAPHERRWFRARATPIGDGGRVSHLLISHENVTREVSGEGARRRAEALERRASAAREEARQARTLARLGDALLHEAGDAPDYGRALEPLAAPLGALALSLTVAEDGTRHAWGDVPAPAPREARLRQQVAETGETALLDGGPDDDALAAEPVRASDGTFEAVLVCRRAPGPWTAGEQDLLRRAAATLGLALERAQAARRLERQRQLLELQNAELKARSGALEAFAELAVDAEAGTDDGLPAFVRRAQEVVLGMLPPGFAVYYEPEGGEGGPWRVRSQVGDLGDPDLQRAIDAGLPFEATRNLLEPWRSGEPFYQDEYDTSTDHLDDLVQHVGATACLPVLVNGRVRGVFSVGLFGRRRWSAADRAALASSVRSLGLAAERAEARRTLTATQRYLKVVADHAPLLLFATDPEGRYTFSEGRLLADLGLRPGQAVGHSAFKLFAHEPDLREARRLRRALAGEEAHDLLHAAGRVYESWFIPVKDDAGRVTQVVGVSMDVTERVRQQDALARSNENLRRSNADLEQFAYVASHDLQAPIRAMTSFAGLLERRAADKLDGSALEYLRQIVTNGQHLKRLVDDLLTYSRASSRPFECGPVDAGAVLAEVARGLAPELAATGGTVEGEELPVVTADPAQLATVLRHLVENALKYRREGMPPVVRVRAAREGNAWHLSVEDNGLGIDAAYHDRIFVMFQRLHHRHEYAGTGIGLALARKIVERHGGRLWVESVSDEGSTFSFTLPDGG